MDKHKVTTGLVADVHQFVFKSTGVCVHGCMCERMCVHSIMCTAKGGKSGNYINRGAKYKFTNLAPWRYC